MGSCENTYPSGLSDQPLLILDERVGLRDGDVKQISDSLRRCQGKPMGMWGQSATRSPE